MKYSTLPLLVSALAGLLPTSAAYEFTQEQLRNQNRTVNIGYVMYQGYQPLDVIGPLDQLYGLSRFYKINLSIIAETTGPIGSKMPQYLETRAPKPPFNAAQFIDIQLVATHTFASAPKLDLMFVPGGVGNRYLLNNNKTGVEDFLRARYPETDYTLSVCTGAAMLTRAGVLDGRSATTNKLAWTFATSFGKNVTWVPNARWVVDGNVWTSSGVSAGMDMAAAFIKHYWGEPVGNEVINSNEYAAHTDSHWDPFAVVHNVPGADKNRSLFDSVGPAPSLWD